MIRKEVIPISYSTNVQSYKMNENIPMRNPMNPTHADSRCTIGLSNTPVSFPAILWRKEIKVKVMKKMTENKMATATNAGVVAVGAERRRFGALPGRVVRSAVWAEIKSDGRAKEKCNVDRIPYTGEMEASVQLIRAALFVFEHEPCCAMVNNNPPQFRAITHLAIP
jgi:hypothetical protein